MADQEVQIIDEGYRLLITDAGLDQAFALFPMDVLVAIKTAAQVRESFALLVSANNAFSSLALGIDVA